MIVHMNSIPLEIRLWMRVDIKGDEECWPWLGVKDLDGYGCIHFNENGLRGQRAHRAAYMVSRGEIDSSLMVCHSCDNPSCCNPSHLFLGTAQDNSDDMKRKGRDKCPRGEEHYAHKLTDDDISYIRKMSSWGVGGCYIAMAYNVSPKTISKILLHQRRKVLV